MFQRIKSTGKHVYLICEDPHDLWQQDVANMCTTLSYTIQYKICKAPCCRGFRGAIIWPQCLWFATCAEGNVCKTWLTQLELKEKFIIFLGQPNQWNDGNQIDIALTLKEKNNRTCSENCQDWEQSMEPIKYDNEKCWEMICKSGMKK